MKLRLLLWEECNRNCPGCCNKDWNLETLPVCRDFSPYDTVMLTGGEPMMCPPAVHNAVRTIRKDSDAEIYVYTAKVDNSAAISVLSAVDGMTVTLHTQVDVEPFLNFTRAVANIDRSLRVNIFQGIEVDVPPDWQIKRGMYWVKNCPLPEDEVFMRYEPEEETS